MALTPTDSGVRGKAAQIHLQWLPCLQQVRDLGRKASLGDHLALQRATLSSGIAPLPAGWRGPRAAEGPSYLQYRELTLCMAVHHHGHPASWLGELSGSLLRSAEPQWEGIDLLRSLGHGEDRR